MSVRQYAEMSYTDRAILAISATERSLKDQLHAIAQEALAAEAYTEVSAVAELASKVSDALRNVTGSLWLSTPVADVTTNGASPGEADGQPAGGASLPLKTARATLRRDQYPIFLRDGQRLVKIAWSKKHRKPYEHWAPFSVVGTLVAAIQRKGERKVFQAADILPLKNGAQEYPSYQSYLALFWLRHVDVVGKRGREGYFLRPKAATPEKLDALWMKLPSPETIGL